MWERDFTGTLRNVLAAGAWLVGIGWASSHVSWAAEPAYPISTPSYQPGNFYQPHPIGNLDTNTRRPELAIPVESQSLASAEDDPCGGRLQSWFDDRLPDNWLKSHGIAWGGWLDQGFTWNPDDPRNNVNGPVTFNDRANEYQLNQLYLFLEKAVDQDAQHWQLGGRTDLLFGTDYYFTQALGLELEPDGTQRWNSQDGPNRTFGPDTGSLYGLAMPQLYAEMGGYGWSVKGGHFYTIIGYEVVPAPANFFYSHAYTMQYGEPFTHTGVLVSYNLNRNWAVSGGFTNGWDSFDNVNDRYNFLGGVTWTSDDENTSLAFAITTGDETSVLGTDNRTMYSIVFTRQLTDKLSYVLQHDYGFQRNALAAAAGFQNAQWYGVNQYLFYDLTDDLRAGLRYEWFRDDDGTRVLGDGRGVNFQELTTGLNWKIHDCLQLRPEVRWDWADGGARPYDDGTDGSQFLFATDLILSF